MEGGEERGEERRPPVSLASPFREFSRYSIPYRTPYKDLKAQSPRNHHTQWMFELFPDTVIQVMWFPPGPTESKAGGWAGAAHSGPGRCVRCSTVLQLSTQHLGWTHAAVALLHH